MKKITLYTVLALLLLCMWGCTPQDVSQEIPQETLPDPTHVYAQAVEHLKEHNNLTMTVKTAWLARSNGQTNRISASQTIRYRNISQNNFSAQVQETLTVGEKTISPQYTYANGQYSLSINNTLFYSELSPDEFMARYVPVVPLNPENYEKIDYAANSPQTTLLFTQPVHPEYWASDTADTLHSAEGTVELDDDGHILRCTYNISYTIADVSYLTYYSISYDTADSSAWDAPQKSTGTFIPTPDAPVLLELASAQLVQAESVSSALTEQIICQAGGITRSEKLGITIAGDNLAVDTSVELTDHAKSGQTAHFQQRETFIDGEYSVTVNDGYAAGAEIVTQETMVRYCADTLVRSILLPEHITQMQITEEDSSILLEFSGDHALALAVFSDACTAIYKDASLLEKMASAYTAGSVTGYLRLDTSTYLPMQSGYVFSGDQTMDSHAYKMTVQLDQRYTFPAAVQNETS